MIMIRQLDQTNARAVCLEQVARATRLVEREILVMIGKVDRDVSLPRRASNDTVVLRLNHGSVHCSSREVVRSQKRRVEDEVSAA